MKTTSIPAPLSSVPPLDEMQWHRRSAVQFTAGYRDITLELTKIGDKHWRITIVHPDFRTESHEFATRRRCAVWGCERIGIRRFHSFRLLVGGSA